MVARGSWNGTAGTVGTAKGANGNVVPHKTAEPHTDFEVGLPFSSALVVSDDGSGGLMYLPS